jgi:hypothetical protein
LLADEGGRERCEPYAVLGHLAGQRRGQAGLGCQLQREAGQVCQFGVVGGDRQVDDLGQCRGKQLVEGRLDDGLVRGAAGQLGEDLGEESSFPALAGRELRRGDGEGRQLRGVGQVLLG